MCKKVFTMIAALAMVLTMAGCSGKSSAGQNGSTPTGTESQPTTAPATTQGTEPSSATFQQVTLVDNDICTFTVTAEDADNIFGYTLKVFLENKTEKNLMFTVESVSVNGFMCDPFWATTVAAGKKANEEISFSNKDFEDNGIENVTEVTFTLRVYDSDNILSDNLVEETFTVNP